MTPLCNLGWHRISQNVRWNRGYYFSRCERCGRDLVRTIYGRWHEPLGYRVVWQAAAPACPGPTPPDTTRPGLPIQHVLNRLKCDEVGLAHTTSATLKGELLPASASGEGEGHPGDARPADLLEQRQPFAVTPEAMVRDQRPGSLAREDNPFAVAFDSPGGGEGLLGDGAPTPAGVLEAKPPETAVPEEDAPPGPLPGRADAPSSHPAADPDAAKEPRPDSALRGPDPAPDFMAGDEGESAWESLLNSPNAAASNGSASSGGFSRNGVPASVMAAFGGLLGQLERLGASSRRSGWRRLRAFFRLDLKAADTSPATATLAGLAGGAAVSILAGAFAISLLLVRGSEPLPSPVRAASFSTSVAATGYVTASLLNCRTAPAREAGVARRLSRGDEIDILANDAGWASVGFRGRQCWVQARYVSSVLPLRAR